MLSMNHGMDVICTLSESAHSPWEEKTMAAN